MNPEWQGQVGQFGKELELRIDSMFPRVNISCKCEGLIDGSLLHRLSQLEQFKPRQFAKDCMAVVRPALFEQTTIDYDVAPPWRNMRATRAEECRKYIRKITWSKHVASSTC